MSLEHRAFFTSLEQPDVGFQAAFGFYLGLVVTGHVGLAIALVSSSTAALLGVVPTVLTVVTLAGHVLAKRARGLPERIGHRLPLRIACYIPAVGFGVVALAPSLTTASVSTQFFAVAVGFGLLTAGTAYGLEQLCRNRFVRAVTADEPIATWTYQPTGLVARNLEWLGVLFAMGSLAISFGLIFDSLAVSLFLFVFILVAMGLAAFSGDGHAGGKKIYGKRYGLGMDARPEQRWGKLHAHKHGIRLERGRSIRFVPWGNISALELTEDELIVHRRIRSFRCDRTVIAEPEAVFNALEAASARANDRR